LDSELALMQEYFPSFMSIFLKDIMINGIDLQHLFVNAGEGAGPCVGAGAVEEEAEEARVGFADEEEGAGDVALEVLDASMTATACPSETRSPTFTLISLTTPATGLGMSMVAFSDSTVSRASSAFTVSPAFTHTSITGISL
jgi:hypothetical protein